MRGSGCRENNIMLTAGRLLLRSQDWPGALHAFQRGLAAGRRVQATVHRQCRRRQWRTELGSRVYAGAKASGSGALQGGSGENNSDHLCAARPAADHTIRAGGRGQSNGWADRNVRECAAGVVEALVQLGRFDQAFILKSTPCSVFA